MLVSKQMADDIKQFPYEIWQKHHVIIRNMETDRDHIHYMTEPTMSASKIVNMMKSYTAYHIWKGHQNCLQKHFWKGHTFWTDGYFACSVGDVSEEMLRKYIENQGEEGGGMVRDHHLAKSISDVSWYELTRQLEYRAAWNGRKYIKVDTTASYVQPVAIRIQAQKNYL